MEPATLNLRHHLYPNPLFCFTKPTSTRRSLCFHRLPMAFPSLHLDARRRPSFPPKPLYVVSCQQPASGHADDKPPAGPLMLPASLVEEIYQSSKKTSFWARFLSYRKPSLRSLYLAALWGPKEVKQAVEDAKEAYRDSNFSEIARQDFNKTAAQDRIDWDDLRRDARKLEMAGKEAEAIQKLERIISNKGSEEKYEASLLMAEMLIYKGKNILDVEEKLLGILDAGKPEDPKPTDARPLLLLAVARAMREGDSVAARKSWDEYVCNRRNMGIRGGDSGPPMEENDSEAPTDSEENRGEDSRPVMEENHWKAPTDFKQFLELVEYLKHEIRTA